MSLSLADMPTRLDHDRDTGRIALPQGPSTRRAILQALASALMAAALPGTRAQQKAEKLLMHYDDKPKGEQQCDRRRAVPPPGVRADARLRAQASWLGCANVAALPAIAPFGLRFRG